MKARINLITIWTDHMETMKMFYCNALGFKIQNDLGEYVEFENEGVRFALCLRSVMYPYTDAYRAYCDGQAFELAFPCDSIDDVDQSYKRLLEQGAEGIHEPQNMPWHQRTALFADPDGNIHELFVEL